MKKRVGILMCALAIVAIIFSCSYEGDNKQPPALNVFTAADIHLGEHMRDIQYYTLKLGLSVQQKNAPLAQFYLHEVNEVYDELNGKQISDAGIDISGLLRKLFQPGLKSMDSVLTQNDTARFIPVYTVLIAKCNSCHKAANHPYLVIQMPVGNFNGQDFNVR